MNFSASYRPARIAFSLSALIVFAACDGHNAETNAKQDPELQKIVNEHLDKYRQAEYISAINLSVDEDGKTTNVYAGTTEFEGRTPVTDRNLYQVGSITKSFVAAILLQLEAESRLHSIDDKLSVYLPQYSAWGGVTIRQLLNMTSGIPDYALNDTFLREIAYNFDRQWFPEELINYALAKPPLFPAGTAFDYSNSNYILAGLVIEKITGHTLEDEMNRRFLGKRNLSHLKLNNTSYVSGRYPAGIGHRMVHGYQFGGDIGKYIPLKQDVTQLNMSYAGAAGAIISNTEDTSYWIRSLFTTNLVLPEKQLKELTSLVSVTTGQPIEAANAENPSGFGLGIFSSYLGEGFPGLAYNYDADTMGYRASYLYLPVENLMITTTTNSYVSSENNNLGALTFAVYSHLKK